MNPSPHPTTPPEDDQPPVRQIVVDTETTGLELSQGHRVIEIGCVEIIGRRRTENNFHRYLDPQRDIDEAASEVHGLTPQLLEEKGAKLFEAVADELLDFLRGAELLIHNAAFDIGFLNHEFERAGRGENALTEQCTVLDTLEMARGKHPGQRCSLDALCGYYGVDNTQRDLHGALLDAEILADVYLAMTGGQVTFISDALASNDESADGDADNVVREHIETPIIRATEAELAEHQKWVKLLAQQRRD